MRIECFSSCKTMLYKSYDEMKLVSDENSTGDVVILE